MLSLSGNKYFPYCYGLVGDNMILMQLLAININQSWSSYDTLSKYMRNISFDISYLNLYLQILNAFHFMHNKLILHNDIKGDNILITPDLTPRIIDFGKATLKTHPVVYNLSCTESEKYNRCHRHLAYELRNIKGSKRFFNWLHD